MLTDMIPKVDEKELGSMCKKKKIKDAGIEIKNWFQVCTLVLIVTGNFCLTAICSTHMHINAQGF